MVPGQKEGVLCDLNWEDTVQNISTLDWELATEFNILLGSGLVNK